MRENKGKTLCEVFMAEERRKSKWVSTGRFVRMTGSQVQWNEERNTDTGKVRYAVYNAKGKVRVFKR